MATRRRICRIRVLAKNLPFLANLSTRQNGHFGKLARLDTFVDIRQPVLVRLDTFVDIRHPTLPGLNTFVDIRQPVLVGLDTFAGLGECIECIESVESSKFCIVWRT
jgi:hypothetical protein